MNGVLLLNATFEPLNIVSVKRAIVLLLKEKAELIEASDAQIRAERWSIERPLVIRLVVYIPIPRRLPLPLSRRTVLARDIYTCQYCGAQPGRAELTIDHILPRSRGGGTTWENVTTACGQCNRRKGDRTPEEARMTLLTRPERPRFVALALLAEPGAHEVWKKYLS